MHVTIIDVQVKQEHVEAFVEASRRNHEASVREPGNLRFDILRSAEDPTRFVFYEVFRSAEDNAAHKKTPHYLAWRAAVEGFMASPRQGKTYVVVAPRDPERW